MAETEEDLQEIQEMFEHFRFVVDKGQTPLRIDKYLSTHMENTSRHRIQLAIKQEYIRVNDTVVKANYIAKPGDVITLVMPFEKHEYEIRPENIPLNVVYEDEDVLVINKPAGLVVHPGHGHFSGTLLNALAWHLGIDGKDSCDDRLGILVHRIDKDTSGLLKTVFRPQHRKKIYCNSLGKHQRRQRDYHRKHRERPQRQAAVQSIQGRHKRQARRNALQSP